MIREAEEEEVYRVLFDPNILPHISDEDILPEEFPLPDDCLYLTHSGDEIWIVHPNGQVHANILPGTKDKRKKTLECIRYLFDEKGFEDLWAEIPLNYTNVCRFTIDCGFNIVYKDLDNYYLRLRKDGIR